MARMGQSLKGCLNMNDWRHLFTPNSESANAGRLACVDHWMRVQQPGAPVRLASEKPGEEKDQDTSSMVTYGLWAVAAIGVGYLAYRLWKAYA